MSNDKFTFKKAVFLIYKFWIKFLKSLYKKGNASSIILFAFIGILVLTIFKVNNSSIFYYLSVSLFFPSYLFILYLIINDIIQSISDISTLKYFSIDNHKYDHLKRLDIIGMLSAILYSLIMIFPFTFTNRFDDSAILKILGYPLLIVGLVYLILKFSNRFLTSVLIFSSTAPGLMILLYGLALAFSIIAYSLSIISGSTPESKSLFEFVDLESLLIIILISPKYYPVIIIHTISSLMIQLLIIIIRPAYLLSKTKFSYKTISVIFTLITIALMLYVNEIQNYFLNVVINFKFTQDNLKELLTYTGDLTSYIRDNFIQKLITILFLPYSVGSIICLFLIDCKENRYQKIAKKHYYQALISHKLRIYENTLTHLKKCIYFGGESFEFIILNTCEFKSYLSHLGYNRMLFESPSRSTSN